MHDNVFEDEEDPTANKLTFQAKSLVSVVRVDSYFSTNLTPRVKVTTNLTILNQNDTLCKIFFQSQVSTNIGSFNISFVNHCSSLKKESRLNDQEIAVISLDSTRVGIELWDKEDVLSEINVRFKSQVQMTFVDFLFLAKHHLLLPFKLQSQAHFVLTNSGPQSEIQLHSKQIMARYGHFANECVKTIKSMWMKTEKKFAFCLQIRNGSHSPMRIGQADTDEVQVIKPGEILQYPWRSQKARLMLRISLESVLQDAKWKFSEVSLI